MASLDRIFAALMSGRSDANTHFDDVGRILNRLGFVVRIKGGHHIFHRAGVAEILNLQKLKGGKAKAYQVKQVREIVLKYGLQFPTRD